MSKNRQRRNDSEKREEEQTPLPKNKLQTAQALRFVPKASYKNAAVLRARRRKMTLKNFTCYCPSVSLSMRR